MLSVFCMKQIFTVWARVIPILIDTQEKCVLPREDWNTFNTKELALNIGKNAGMLGLQAAAITTGFDFKKNTRGRDRWR